MTSEDFNQHEIRRVSAFHGVYWRNNSGACQDAKTGRLIRYGLANDSKRVNEKVKSSDLIGITPVTIGLQHVGMTFGVFTAIEAKHTGWHLTPGDAHGQAQAAFHAIVRNHGGFAGFASSPEDFYRIIGK